MKLKTIIELRKPIKTENEVKMMDAMYAKQILKSLADGIHPMTGEVLPKTDSCNVPDVIRALHLAVQELEKLEKPARKSQWENAGLPWSESDEKTLCEMFDRGDSKKEICNYFKRSEGAIAARLVKLGKIQSREAYENRYR